MAVNRYEIDTILVWTPPAGHDSTVTFCETITNGFQASLPGGIPANTGGRRSGSQRRNQRLTIVFQINRRALGGGLTTDENETAV